MEEEDALSLPAEARVAPYTPLEEPPRTPTKQAPEVNSVVQNAFVQIAALQDQMAEMHNMMQQLLNRPPAPPPLPTEPGEVADADAANGKGKGGKGNGPVRPAPY